MNKWDDLIEKCPRLFKEGCSFECGLGWYDIIADLSMKIEPIIEKVQSEYIVPEGEDDVFDYMYICQVKEKYGSLRFYMSVTTDEINALIDEAEILSLRVCESCGKPGKLDIKHLWMSVRCDECRNEGK